MGGLFIRQGFLRDGRIEIGGLGIDGLVLGMAINQGSYLLPGFKHVLEKGDVEFIQGFVSPRSTFAFRACALGSLCSVNSLKTAVAIPVSLETSVMAGFLPQKTAL